MNCALYCVMVVKGEIRHWNTKLKWVKSYEMLRLAIASCIRCKCGGTNKVDGNLPLPYVKNLFFIALMYCVVRKRLECVLCSQLHRELYDGFSGCEKALQYEVQEHWHL